MDKQKISVDDLFRQRLADREAPLPPGAWSRMEGLLDAQMPTGGAPLAAVGGQQRRGGWVFLLLGLLVAGGGSFIYHQAQQPAATEATAAISHSAEKSQSASQPEATSLSTSGAAPIALATAERPSAGRRNAKTYLPATPKHQKEIPAGKASKENRIPVAAVAAKNASDALPIADAPPQHITAVAPTFTQKQTAKAPATAPVLAGMPLQNRPAPEEVSPMSWVAAKALDAVSGKIVNRTSLTQVENYLYQWAARENNLPVAAPQNAWSAKTPVNAPVAAAPPALSGVASSIAAVPILPSNEAKPAAQSPLVAAPVVTTAPKIEDAVKGLRDARYAIGLFAGINSTLSAGSGALQGLHAGILGLLKLSEKWSLGAELRYALRLNNSMDLKDDYFSGKTINEASVMRNGRPYNALRYEIDSMLSRYSFGSYSSIELPLQVRYNHNRFAVYGGPSVAFHFRPAVTRTDTRIGTISRYDTLDAAFPLPQLPSRASNVSLSDFDSRLSLGYNIGAQYRITPTLHLDLRLSHQLWDNLQDRSAGARRVSETYLHIPSVQFSAGYFFKGKTRPTPPKGKP